MDGCNSTEEVEERCGIVSGLSEDVVSIAIFPIPCKDRLTVHGLKDNTFKYQIYNVNGILMEHGISSGTIYTQDLIKGIYFLRISSTAQFPINVQFVKD